MRRVLSFLSGAFIGALLGAVFALLFAPSSGEALRFQIQERLITIQEEVNQAAAERRAELEEQLATMRTPQKPGGTVS